MRQYVKPMTSPKPPFKIHPDTSLAHVELHVKGLANMVVFYRDLRGSRWLENGGGRARLSATGKVPALLTLIERTDARPQGSRFAGLYHTAFCYTGRPALANGLMRLVSARWPLQGAADHGVSEVIYLADPEGNGIEIYRDRPRQDWPRLQDGVQMGNLPLDLHKLLEEAAPAAAQAGAIDAGTDIGHIHLQVSDLAKARSFYHQLLSLDIMMELPTALFMSAGGYHHHLGANIWNSRQAPRRTAGELGLASYAFLIPDEAGWLAVFERLQAQAKGSRVVQRDQRAGLALEDQDGITVELLTPDTEAVRQTLARLQQEA